MHVACTLPDLVEAARTLTNLTERERDVIQTYLLARIAAGSLDPQVLLNEAAAFQSYSQSQLLQIQTGLLCQIAGVV